MNIDLYHQRQKCCPVSLVFGNKRFVQTFAGFPGEGRQTTVGRSTTAIFRAFGRYIVGTVRDKVNMFIQ